MDEPRRSFFTNRREKVLTFVLLGLAVLGIIAWRLFMTILTRVLEFLRDFPTTG